MSKEMMIGGQEEELAEFGELGEYGNGSENVIE